MGIGIDPGEEQTYIVTFTFIETGSEQNYNQDKSFNGVLSIISSNEAYTLMGALLNSNGDPVGGATVELHSTLRTGITDSNGLFEIKGVEVGNHEVNIKNSSSVTIATDSIALLSSEIESINGKQLTVSTNKGAIDVKITLGESSINTITALDWYEKCTSSNTNLRCKILSDNTEYADNISSTYVAGGTGINFGAVSSDTNGKGVYYTVNPAKTEDGKRVYYYRGAVTNNYLIFGGYCWRIVRTVEDGSTRLRYGGVPTNGVCLQTGTDVSITMTVSSFSDNAYQGYMYGPLEETISSILSSLYIWNNSTNYYSTTYARNSLNQFYLTGSMISGKWNTASICDSSVCPAANYYTCGITSSSGTCNTLYKILSWYSSSYANGNKISYASESYTQAHSNINDTPIKKVVDAWYTGGTTDGLECGGGTQNCSFTTLSTKLVDYSSLIADTPYCNDRTIGAGGEVLYAHPGPDDGYYFGVTGYGFDATIYGTARRIATGGPTGKSFVSNNASPIYKCPQNNDKFTLKVANGGTSGHGNNALNYPIGLLTADEASYAGLAYEKDNSKLFIY